MTLSSDEQRTDWAAGKKGLLLAWGLPIGAMLIAIFIDPLSKMIIWIAALVWMGSACLLNARRCGRVHCYYTGPFFLIMTIPVALHGFSILHFGQEGWRWLGITISLGGGGIWYLTEKVWGRYRRSP